VQLPGDRSHRHGLILRDVIGDRLGPLPSYFGGRRILWRRSLTQDDRQDEPDRVAKAFRGVAQRQAAQDRIHTVAIIIQVLEEKRREVMAIDQAAYFIRTWRELNDQVRQMIGQGECYRVINPTRMTDRGTSDAA